MGQGDGFDPLQSARLRTGEGISTPSPPNPLLWRLQARFPPQKAVRACPDHAQVQPRAQGFGHTFPGGLQGGRLMSRISIWAFALVAGLSQPAVAADGVMYTCVDAKGARTYQNAPCPRSSTTQGARSYVDPGWSHQAASKVEADRQAIEWRRALGAGPAPSYGRAYDEKDCENARGRRDRLRRQIGSQRITWAQEQELCGPVQAACGFCQPGVPVIAP